MLLLLSALTAFGLFEVLAYRHGAESRSGFDERLERGHRRNV
ncbi:MAG: hypothetical protein QOE31_2 [Solirubrobacteraceae bacterium]|jgi:hypothetical protein|nr:hypothetical protein [Solirubrobacteraceae bacterium]